MERPRFGKGKRVKAAVSGVLGACQAAEQVAGKAACECNEVSEKLRGRKPGKIKSFRFHGKNAASGPQTRHSQNIRHAGGQNAWRQWRRLWCPAAAGWYVFLASGQAYSLLSACIGGAAGSTYRLRLGKAKSLPQSCTMRRMARFTAWLTTNWCSKSGSPMQ